MAQLSSFFDANMVNGVPDRQYDATAWANYFSGFIGNGVSNSPSTNLQVTAGTGLQVIVNSGIGYINGYYYNNTEPLTVNINTANATYPRITSIVIELNLNNREIICKTIDGNAQTSPTTPQITQTESTYQLQLATVYVPAGATHIGQITDTRGNENVCGYVQMKVSSELASLLGYQLAQLNSNYYNQVSFPTMGVWGDSDICNNPILGGGQFPSSAPTGNIVFSVGGTNSVNMIIDGEYYGENGEVPIIRSIRNLQNGNFEKPLQNISLEGTTHNNGEIYGGSLTAALITDSTLEQPTINGGGLNNIGLEGICNNDGTINGGKISNVAIINCNLEGNINNFTTISGGSYDAPTINGGNLIGDITNLTTINKGNYNNPTLSGDIAVNGIAKVSEVDGAIYYLDDRGNTCIEEAVDASTWFIRNYYTGKNIIDCTPVKNGNDTVNLNATVNGGTFDGITLTGSVTLWGGTGIHGGAITDTTFSGGITNIATIKGGSYNNPTFSGNEIKNDGVISGGVYNNQTLWGTIINDATTKGGIYDTPTIQNGNLTGGLHAFNQNIVNVQENLPSSVQVTNNAKLNAEISFWQFHAPLLGGQNVGGAIGILTVNLVATGSFNWDGGNSVPLDLSQIPAFSSAITITPGAPFQIGCGNGVVWVNGTGSGTAQGTHIVEGQTYTAQALMFQ